MRQASAKTKRGRKKSASVFMTLDRRCTMTDMGLCPIAPCSTTETGLEKSWCEPWLSIPPPLGHPRCHLGCPWDVPSLQSRMGYGSPSSCRWCFGWARGYPGKFQLRAALLPGTASGMQPSQLYMRSRKIKVPPCRDPDITCF